MSEIAVAIASNLTQIYFMSFIEFTYNKEYNLWFIDIFMLNIFPSSCINYIE